jgi:hypothetical protein
MRNQQRSRNSLSLRFQQWLGSDRRFLFGTLTRSAHSPPRHPSSKPNWPSPQLSESMWFSVMGIKASDGRKHIVLAKLETNNTVVESASDLVTSNIKIHTHKGDNSLVNIAYDGKRQRRVAEMIQTGATWRDSGYCVGEFTEVIRSIFVSRTFTGLVKYEGE